MKNQILTEKEYRDMREKYEDDFDAGMGAESVKKLLADIDLESLSEQLRSELKTASGQKKLRIIKRLEVVEAFRISGNDPDLDDHGRAAGHSPGAASHGPARRRPLRDV